MNESLKDRLNKVFPRIQSQELLNNAGLGNEIGFYIFDYHAKEELEVREFVQSNLAQLSKKNPSLRVVQVNLFTLIIGYLKNRNLLERALKIQKENGDEALRKALSGPLHEHKIAKAFVNAAEPDKHDIVIMTGVGTAWPLLRSHTLLNNLHPLMEGRPLVIFYPGSYDGQGLSLFSQLGDSNYYRAFKLVP